MNKIGIIGAMEIEVETLKSHMQITNTLEKASMTFLEGILNDIPVVIVRSGVGKVNAGICVQILSDVFHVTHVINTGVAGSLNAEINIGDIVVSTDALYHDVDATGFGYPVGEVPQLGTLSFAADAAMISQAKASCELVNPEIKVFEGRIVSGDQFISSPQVKDSILKNFPDSYCTEMEGAAIAHASWLNHIPFVIIRAISDKADDSAHMDYPAFEKAAAEHSARLVEHMISRL
ncbi:MAG: 5'-methylthioadenosine/adenosylhomocysteine nucleosidase [Lachnospiraceae bacterium]|nr:5'-methylthioadenosine/adenosylhomocysteine nucleosidase [Lachnospiraceae bacterium]